MTIDINHADSFGCVLPAVCPDIKRDLAGEVGIKVAVVRGAHEVRLVIEADQLLIRVSSDSAIFAFPAEAVRADQLS